MKQVARNLTDMWDGFLLGPVANTDTKLLIYGLESSPFLVETLHGSRLSDLLLEFF